MVARPVAVPPAGPPAWSVAARALHRSGFLPSDLPGLVRWLDPRRLAGLVDGDPVEALADLAGVADASAAGAARPSYRDGSVRADGRPYLEFDGSASSLSIGALTGARMTLYWAASLDAPGGYDTFFGKASYANSLLQWNSGDRVRLRNGIDSIVDVDSEPPAQLWMLYELSVDGANGWSLWANGQVLATAATDFSGGLDFDQIGMRGASSEPLDGKLGEVVAFGRLLQQGERDLMRGYLSGWLNPIHLDAEEGDDGNDGWGPASPRQTLEGVEALPLVSAGQSVLLKRGSVWRETLFPQVGGQAGRWYRFGAYGSGANPLVIGTNREDGPWSDAGGGEYGTALAAEPYAVYWWSAEGDRTTIRRLQRGSAGALADEGWDWTGGTLTVKIGQDPSGQAIEISRNDGHGLRMASNSGGHILVENIDSAMHSGSGYRADYPNVIFRDGASVFNENDGLGGGGPGFGIYGYRLFLANNGDEGVSFHGVSGGEVEDCVMLDNMTGINSEIGTTTVFRRCLVKGSVIEALSWAAGTTGGEARLEACVLERAQGAAVKADGEATSALRLLNCTLVNAGARDVPGIEQVSGLLELKNCLVQGFTTGLTSSGGTREADWNAYWDNSADHGGGASAGAHDLSADPLFAEAEAGDFTPGEGSAVLRSGLELLIEKDFLGRPWPSGRAPDRGAIQRP